MEKAIIINRMEHFKYWTKKYGRIYFGNEFCPRLLPTAKEIDAAMEIVKKEKLRLTLLTPPVDSQGLKTIKRVLGYLAKRRMLEEAVVNDYGVLNYLKRYFSCRIVLGRILSRFAFLQSGSFLYRQGIRRFEFDDLNEIRDCKGASVSYYYPYLLTFATRYCPVAGIRHNRLKNHGIISCSRECLEIGELKVYNPIFAKPQILMGNAQFMENKIGQRNLNKAPNGKYIDRLVFQPRPPV